MTYRCLRDCLCQKHEIDSLGRYVELVNLRAKEGEVYDEAYDMLEFNKNDEGVDFFEPVNAMPTKRSASDIKPLERRMPPVQKPRRRVSKE